jgi:hypothetical protein
MEEVTDVAQTGSHFSISQSVVQIKNPEIEMDFRTPNKGGRCRMPTADDDTRRPQPSAKSTSIDVWIFTTDTDIPL